MSLEVSLERLRSVLTQVEAMAGGDLGVRIPISPARDEVDAISFGINILADEIQYHLAVENKKGQELVSALCQLEKTLSDLKTTQDQLIQSAKMAALGEFSAGLAHEINNPLTVIRAHVDAIENLAQKKTALTACELLPPIERVKSSVDRMAKIIKHVRDFSVPQSTVGSLSLNDVITSAAEFVLAQLEIKGIDLQIDLASEELLVMGNQIRLEQVMLNMIANAVDAIHSKGIENDGRIEIKTLFDHAGPILTISDNGCGIEGAIMNKIYLPFFTTKDPSCGPGIGLSICHRILSSYGASICCESEVGRSTRFTIRFPKP